jgi:hypothetical protein
MSDLYTVVCECGGGTYISQVNARSPADASSVWLEAEEVSDSISEETREQIKDGLTDDLPVAIGGCHNVWCCTSNASQGLVLINLVRTVPKAPGSR